MMNFEELDETTRQYMLAEFEAEQTTGNTYLGERLSPAGRAAFPDLSLSRGPRRCRLSHNTVVAAHGGAILLAA